MLRITGILSQQLTGHLLALAAVKKFLFLTAHCYRTLSMKGMSIRFNASAAVIGLLKLTPNTVQSAARIHYRICILLMHKVAII